MTFEELDYKLRQLNDTEIAYKHSILNHLSKTDLNESTIVLGAYKQTSQDVFTMDEYYFIPPGENIFFTTNDRFNSVPPHRHSFIELIYVYSGSCQQTINEVAIQMKTGDICLLDTNVTHTITTHSEEDIVINCLMRKSYFDLSFLSRLSGNDLLSRFFVHAIFQSKDYNNYILFPASKQETIPHVMKNLLCEYYDPGLCSQEIINSYMIILFSELLRIYRKTLPMEQTQTTTNEQVTDILDYLQTNFNTVDLTSTAAHFNFNPSYLSRFIKQTTGKSFMEILHVARIRRVCLMLETTDIPILNLINEVGYANTQYFYQLFKKHEGCTPNEYRKKYRL